MAPAPQVVNRAQARYAICRKLKALQRDLVMRSSVCQLRYMIDRLWHTAFKQYRLDQTKYQERNR